MVTFLHRYAQFSGKEVTGSYDLTEFGDYESVNSFAQKPMEWAVANGMINGMVSLLNPKGKAIPTQIATILLRYFENI